MNLWTEIQGNDHTLLFELAQKYHIHALAIEDSINRDQRPKLEDFGDHQFLVWFMMSQGVIYEMQFIIFADKVILIPHDKPPHCDTWFAYLKLEDKCKDALHLLYYALDRATDETWLEVKRFFGMLDDFEQKMFVQKSDPRSLLRLKRQLNQMEYSIGHLSSLAEQLQNFYMPKNDLSWKFRDLHDHCQRITRNIEIYRSQISSAIDLYWALHAHRTSEHIMKLSVMASIALPLTFWCSFWGMNFEKLPFRNENVFYIAMITMPASAIGVAVYFMKKGYWHSTKN